MYVDREVKWPFPKNWNDRVLMRFESSGINKTDIDMRSLISLVKDEGNVFWDWEEISNRNITWK